MRWRADKITEFMGDLHDAVKTRKPKTVFSVSPNYQDFAYKFSLQDWLSWVRQDFVDEIVMQVYRNDYNSFVEQLERAEVKESQQKISMAIGILSGLPRRPIAMEQVEAQSRAAAARPGHCLLLLREPLGRCAGAHHRTASPLCPDLSAICLPPGAVSPLAASRPRVNRNAMGAGPHGVAVRRFAV